MVESGDYNSYQAFIKQHPSATVYHTVDWHKVIYNTYAYGPNYIVVQDTGQTTGVLPLFEVNSLLSGRHLTSIPFCHYAQVLYQNEEALQALVSQAQQMARQRHCKYIEIRGSAEALAKLGFQVSAHNWVSQLDLRVETKTLWKNMHSSTKRNIKKAQKHNLTVRRGVDTADFDIFYRLMVETRRHQGVPPHPARLYTALQAMPQSRLYLSCYGEQILAGIIIFCYGTHVNYAYGASTKDQELLRARPNDLLFWQVITETQAEGYETFSFGSTPKNNQGLLRFKENWGAQSELLAYAYWLNTAERIPVVERDSKIVRLVRTTIRYMPLWLVRLIGELFFKKLG